MRLGKLAISKHSSFVLILICFLHAFNTLIAQPIISNFSPKMGPIGSTINIEGENFSSIATENVVYFGAVKGEVISVTTLDQPTKKSLAVRVPSGASFAPISVTVNRLTSYSRIPFTITFNGGSLAFTGTSFGNRFDVPSPGSQNGFGLTTAKICNSDFDGDGKIDIAVPIFSTNTINVLRNTSTNNTLSFQSALFGCGLNPLDIIVADIDGDTKQDIISLEMNASTFSVLQNQSTSGAISFSAKQSFATQNRVTFHIASADIDNDGKTDILIANKGRVDGSIVVGNTISIYRNQSSGGNISFANEITVPTADFPSNLVLRDFDGDRKPDILVSYGGLGFAAKNFVSILRNTSTSGTITFSNRQDFTTGTSTFSDPLGVVAEDFDGDEIPDFAAINANDNTISVFRNISNAGTLAFSSKNDFTAKSFLDNISAADLNGDGKIDIVANGSSASEISILKNISTVPGMLSFASRVDYPYLSNTSNTNIADYDGNGNPDIGTRNMYSVVSILPNAISSNSCSAPNISVQPVDKSSTTTGSTSFSVSVVDGNTPYTYQWQYKRPGDGAWNSFLGPGPFPPFTNWNTSELGINNPDLEYNNCEIRCIIYSGGSCNTFSTTSNIVKLLVSNNTVPLNAGSIATSQNICFNATPAPFTSTTLASGGSGTINYQWQISSDGINFTNIVSATEVSYASGPLTSTTFFRRGAKTNINTQIFTEPVKITVIELPTAPNISIQPTNQNKPVDGDASFSVSASNVNTTLSYQWQISTDKGSSWSNITSKGVGPEYADWTTNTLKLKAVSATNNDYQYRAVISASNQCGTASSNSNAATLTVTEACVAPQISKNPIDFIAINGTANFTIETEQAVSLYTFQWQTSIDQGTNWTNIQSQGTAPVYAGFTSSVLSITGLSELKNGSLYRCIVTNTGNCNTSFTVSDFAKLVVPSACFRPLIVNHPNSVTATKSSTAIFNVEISGGVSPYNYAWQISKDSGTTWTPITEAGTSPVYKNWNQKALEVAEINLQHSFYQYRCIIANAKPCDSLSITTNPATLIVSQNCISPEIVSQPESVSTTTNNSVTFTVAVNGGTTPYTYQWQVSANDGSSWNNITTAGNTPLYAGWNTNILSLSQVSQNENGYVYRCIITSNKPCNGSNVTSSSAKLSVTQNCVAPIITNQPNDLSVNEDDNISFSVSVSGGVNPYSYQWQVSTNGGSSWTNITSSGSAPSYSNWDTKKLIVSGVKYKNNAYRYRCIISSGKTCTSQSVTSYAALLSVLESCSPPELSKQPTNATIKGGSSVSFFVNVVGGTTPYTYQWQVSTNNGNSWSTILSAGNTPTYADWNTNKLTLSNTTTGQNNYRYRCIVTSGTPCTNSSIKSNSATLSVSSNCVAPVIESHPANTSTSIASGKSSFSISVVNTSSSYTYQWQVSTNNGNTWNNISTEGNQPTYANWRTNSLSLSNISSSNDNYRYRCIVSGVNDCSSQSVISSAAILSINSTTSYSIFALVPSSVQGSTSGSGIYTAGSAVTIRATANQGYSFSKWTENGVDISTNPAYTFIPTSSRSFYANFTKQVQATNYIEIGDVRIYANKIPSSGSSRTISGNVYVVPKTGCTGVGALRFPDNITVNTTTNQITGQGIIYCENVGQFKKLDLLNGAFTLTATNTLLSSPLLNKANILYKLAGLNLAIEGLEVLCDGAKIKGSVALPSILTKSGAEIAAELNGLYLTKTGIDVAGEVNISGVKLGNTVELDYLKLQFDTKRNDFAGSAGLKFPAFSVDAEVEFLSGKIDKIGLGASSSKYAIPVFGTGLSITQIGGSIAGLNNPPRSLSFNATVVPTLTKFIPSLANIKLNANYTFGHSFNAGGTLTLFNQPLVNTSFLFSKQLCEISTTIKLLDVLEGNAKMSISNTNQTGTKLRGGFSASLKVPKDAPKFITIFRKPGSPLGSTNNFLTNEYLSGYVKINDDGRSITFTYLLRYNNLKLDFGFNLNNHPKEAQDYLKLGNSFSKSKVPSLQFQPAIKSNSTEPVKNNDTNFKKLAYSFDLKEYTDNIIITAAGKKASPELVLYINKDQIVTAETANKFKNISYDAIDSVTIIQMYKPVLGTYYVWSKNAESIEIQKTVPAPSIAIKKLTNHTSTKEIDIEYHLKNTERDAKLSFGFDEDQVNINGIVLQDDIIAKNGTASIRINYSKIKTGKFYLYGIVYDTTGQNEYVYDSTLINVITDSAPIAPSNLVIEKNEGSYFISFKRNNTSPVSYILHYAPTAKKIDFKSDYIVIGDTDYVDISQIPGGRKYQFAVSAIDTIGRQSELSNIDSISLPSNGINNSPEFFTTDKKISIKIGQLFQEQIVATDVDQDPLNYTLQDAPTGVQISNQGILSWLPTINELGNRSLFIKVTDPKGGVDSMLYEFFVYDSSSASPILTFDKSGVENYNQESQLSISDPVFVSTNDQQSVVVKVYSDSDLQGLTIVAQNKRGNIGEYLTSLRYTTNTSFGNSLKVNQGDTVWALYTSPITGYTIRDFTVFKPVYADIIFQDSVCNSNAISFFNGSKGAELQYEWKFGDGNFSLEKNPTHIYPNVIGTGTNKYSVELIVTDKNGVRDTINKEITVYKTPEKKIISSGPLTICQGESVTLSVKSGEQFLWTTGSSNNSISVDKPGKYSVAISNGNTCFVADTVEVVVNPLPIVDAGQRKEVQLGSQTILGGKPTAIGVAPFTYKWSPAYGISNDSIANPLATPYKPVFYKVSVLDANGCKNTDHVYVDVTPVISIDKLFAFPNPVKDVLTIQIILPVDMPTSIIIMNVNGNVVKKVIENKILKAGFQQFSVPVGDLAKGTYFIRLNEKQMIPIIRQ